MFKSKLQIQDSHLAWQSYTSHYQQDFHLYSSSFLGNDFYNYNYYDYNYYDYDYNYYYYDYNFYK